MRLHGGISVITSEAGISAR